MMLPIELWVKCLERSLLQDRFSFRGVSKVLKREVEILFLKQTKLWIKCKSSKGNIDCFDGDHVVTDYDCLEFVTLPTLKQWKFLASLFPSVSILKITGFHFFPDQVIGLLSLFPSLVCLVVPTDLTDSHLFFQDNLEPICSLKHLLAKEIYVSYNIRNSFYCLESLDVYFMPDLDLTPKPSKRIACHTPIIPIEWCPESIEVIQACVSFGGYERQYKGTYCDLTEVVATHDFFRDTTRRDIEGLTAFLQDHKFSLRKLSVPAFDSGLGLSLPFMRSLLNLESIIFLVRDKFVIDLLQTVLQATFSSKSTYFSIHYWTPFNLDFMISLPQNLSNLTLTEINNRNSDFESMEVMKRQILSGNPKEITMTFIRDETPTRSLKGVLKKSFHPLLSVEQRVNQKLEYYTGFMVRDVILRKK